MELKEYLYEKMKATESTEGTEGKYSERISRKTKGIATESTEDTEGIILSALGVLGGKENYWEGANR